MYSCVPHGLCLLVDSDLLVSSTRISRKLCCLKYRAPAAGEEECIGPCRLCGFDGCAFIVFIRVSESLVTHSVAYLLIAMCKSDVVSLSVMGNHILVRACSTNTLRRLVA